MWKTDELLTRRHKGTEEKQKNEMRLRCVYGHRM